MAFLTRKAFSSRNILALFIVAIFMVMTIMFYIIHTEHRVSKNPSTDHKFIHNILDSIKRGDNIDILSLLSKPNNNIHPPLLIEPISYTINDHKFHNEFWKSVEPLEPLPNLSKDNKLYVMNIIHNKRRQEMAIFLLNQIYFDPKRGLHSWPNMKIKDIPDRFRNIRKTLIPNYKTLVPVLNCVFLQLTVGKPITYHISPVQYVPNNTTRDKFVNGATEILRCKVPSATLSGFNKVLLTQRYKDIINNVNGLTDTDADSDDDELVHVLLNINKHNRMGIETYTNDKVMKPNMINDIFLSLGSTNQYERYISLCMPPISEPLPFITEHIVHHLSLGIEHIYIGTQFPYDKKEEYLDRLIERVKPWYDDGLITIWPHEQRYLSFTDKSKHHWLNQCLYYAKNVDQYILSLDVDEFLLLYPLEKDSIDGFTRRNTLKSMLQDVTKNGKREWCWLTFASYQMWELTDPDSLYMTGRFNGKESNHQYTWSKVIWDTDHLWYTGYHAGGSCSALNHSWYDAVNDWREDIDSTHVYRFNPVIDGNEGRIFHFYNCRHIRIEPKDKGKRNPWFKTEYDNVMIDYYLPYIKNVIETKMHLNPTYPDDKYDVMKTDYYLKHYGEGKSQNNNYH